MPHSGERAGRSQSRSGSSARRSQFFSPLTCPSSSIHMLGSCQCPLRLYLSQSNHSILCNFVWRIRQQRRIPASPIFTRQDVDQTVPKKWQTDTTKTRSPVLRRR